MSLAAAPRSPWILSPARDLAWFILTPALVIPIVLALQRAIPPETLGLYVLGLGGFGHHLPGFIRAYADPELFRRYKLRFTVVPALLIAVCAAYSLLDLNALVVVTLAWGTWHGAMQINGFARIYDSKAGSFARLTARLDALMCVAWFGLAILSSPAKLFSLTTQFYLSGGFLIPVEAFRLVRAGWAIATAALTALFLANAWRQWKAGTPPNPVKFLVMGVSFAFWWYCMTGMTSLILGVLMWEIFHDLQYNALVWRYQRRRVDGGLRAGRVERALFLPGGKRLALYAALILAYGTIGVFASFADINSPEKSLMGGEGPQWLLRITVASALLHFYYDGFIWRIRQPAVRQGLGLASGAPAAAARETPRAFFGHAWKWALFLAPVAWLGISESRHWGPSLEQQVVNLSRALPGSWLSHFLAGTYYKGNGQNAEAEAQYRLTVRYNPAFATGHLFLGDLLYRRGALPEAASEYESAVNLDPSDADARRNLGFLHLMLGRPSEAARNLGAVLAARPDDAEARFGLATAWLRLGRLDEAEAEANRVLALAPGHAGALEALGAIRARRGARGASAQAP